MLPTFVITLREGLEAALIVAVVAAFLRRQGRPDALRLMWVGVAAAVALCVAAAVALQILNRELPQREQEGLETIVAAVAVAVITFMIIWMRRHGQHLVAELHLNAESAIAQGSAWALVGMAFFAVVREGIETSAFLLAAFQASGDPVSSGGGAAAGLVVAVLLGCGIYRGGTRLNLGRFFRLTAVALVLVAAGLVMSAIHTAHEAGWFNDLQETALNLGWAVRPGTVSSSLLTGVLGLQPRPTVGEAGGWLLYAVPMLAFVLAPMLRRVRWRALIATGIVLIAVVAAGCGSSSNTGSSSDSEGQTLKVTLTDEGCSPQSLTATSGKVTFEVANGGTSKVSEFELKQPNGVILGEKENIVGALDGSFTLSLQPGEYITSCPTGSSDDQGKLVVTGERIDTGTQATPQLNAAVTAYRKYVAAEIALLAADVKRFRAALDAGDLAEAKAQFAAARLHYESIEPVAESFGGLDPKIDARAGDVAPGTPWTGFHRIEEILWVRGTTVGTGPIAKQLVADVAALQEKAGSLFFQPAQLANGAVELLDEVSHSKITGEEDRYSHTDLSDFQGNLDGSRKAFELLRPALVKKGHAELATTIATRFAAVQRGLDRYRRATRLGFAPYTELTPADRRKFAQQIDALAEPLSTVAGKVSG